jgi:hypothetical protein
VIGKFVVCGKRGGGVRTTEVAHPLTASLPCHFHNYGTEKKFLDFMKHVQQTFADLRESSLITYVYHATSKLE